MKLRGLLLFIIIFHASIAYPATIKYIAQPDIYTLNRNTQQQNFYMTKELGLSHALLNEIFKNTDVRLEPQIPSDYKTGIETATLYNETNLVDIIVGITFDEEKLKYLNYIPQPIFTDFIAIITKNLPNDKSKYKDFETTLGYLSTTNNIIKIDGITSSFETNSTTPNISKGAEQVLKTQTTLIAPWEMIKTIISNPTYRETLKHLQILKYPSQKINYFIALNKNSSNTEMKINGKTEILEDFITSRLDEIFKTGIMEKMLIETQKSTL